MRRFSVVACAMLFAFGCQSALTLGAPCSRNSECSAPLTCRLDRCRAECVGNQDCPAGARCLLDHEGVGSCSLAVDDDCHAGECPSPTLCIEGRCRNLCDTTAPCPEGNDCVAEALSTVCVERAVDAGVVDAGVVDAGVVDAATPDADVAMGARVLDVCPGARHVCAVSAPSRRVWCWGLNDAAMLGAGDLAASCAGEPQSCSTTPIAVVREDDQMPLVGVASLACGEVHTCALLENGDVYCWGYADVGELGTSVPGESHREAVRAELPGQASELVSARTHACARVAGAWYCWGENGHGSVIDGRLGDPSFTDLLSPVPRHIPLYDTATLVTAASWSTCAVFGTEARCVGLNDHGQLGAPADALPHPTPPAMFSLPAGTHALTAGDDVYCALAGDGTAWCWGSPDRCALGHDSIGADEVPSPSSSVVWRQIAGGIEAFGFCGLRDSDGAVLCWGQSDAGQAGLPTGVACTPNPIVRQDGTPLISKRVITGGVSCAIDLADALWCWGLGSPSLQGVGTGVVQPRALRMIVPVDG